MAKSLDIVLKDGEQYEVKGSAAKPYIVKNTGGVISCTCPAWRNQSVGIEQRTCKHCRYVLGDAAEAMRLVSLPSAPVSKVEKKATAPPVLLAQTWDISTDPTGYIMSEKLDGVRAWWDGENFISRLGNIYHAPDWFKASMPSETLDGELWMGRKMFQQCVSIVRRQDAPDSWKDIEYVVFDAPKVPGVFTERLKELNKILINPTTKLRRQHLSSLDQVVCKNLAHMKKMLATIEAKGGEGLMLRVADSMYEVGRSSTLLKVKSFQDAEAVVIAHEPGRGKHKNRLGALTVKLANGIQFSVGTGFSDAERENPPPIGSTITFRFQELSDGGVPRFPSFLHVHTEL